MRVSTVAGLPPSRPQYQTRLANHPVLKRPGLKLGAVPPPVITEGQWPPSLPPPMPPTVDAVELKAGPHSQPIAIETRNLNFFYPNGHQALFDVSLQIPKNKVTALIGPSGCGKSTFLKVLNRLHDLDGNPRLTGSVTLGGQDIYAPNTDVIALRSQVGMVFQKPNPFPKSIYENVAFGPRIQGMRKRRLLDPIVEENLKAVGLWDEVKDRLHKSALELSGGQQQRLCIARALAVNPQVILMDEPTSALDPASTARIEQLVRQLSEQYTIVIVTHNMEQAKRLSDKTAFFYEGRIVESGDTTQIFQKPAKKGTQDYISGVFG